MADVATFGGQCGTWGTVCNLWSECISEVVDIIGGGARDPQYWGDHPFDLYNKDLELEKYQQEQPQKHQRLIEIYVKCCEKKFKKTIKIPEQKIFIKVKDVEFILNEMKSVGVDIKNIRKYTDNELHNLLG
jgi:hypothetical protein